MAVQFINSIYQAREYLLIVLFMVIAGWFVLLLLSMEAFGQDSGSGAHLDKQPRHTTCRPTKAKFLGNVGTAPDKVCKAEFGDGWTFAAPAKDIVFPTQDLKKGRAYLEGWCGHDAPNCQGWTSASFSQTGTACNVALRKGLNVGLLGVSGQYVCSERQSAWCCKFLNNGGSQ